MKTFSRGDLEKFANAADDPRSGAISEFLKTGIAIGEAAALKDVMNELRKMDEFAEEKAQNLRQKVLRVINRLPGYSQKKYGTQVFIQRETPTAEAPKPPKKTSGASAPKATGPRTVKSPSAVS